MKKTFCLLCCLILIFTLCSCKDESKDADTSSTTANNNSSSEKNENSLPQNNNSSSENTSSEETPQESVPSNSSPTVSPSTQSQKPQSSNPITVFNFTVSDPNNLRGLSTTKKGFSYGVATNGRPHNQSVLNQTTFDSYSGVEALALDNKTTEKIMYLTFDNGYEYQNLTANILDTLKEKNVKAAFFITLSYAKSNKALVQRMIDEGHIVGNHSTTHPTFPDITRTKMAEEIATLNDYLIQNFSYTSPYFRFPTGAYSECSLELVTSIGFKSVFWSLAYADWDTSAQRVKIMLTKQLPHAFIRAQ